MCCPLDTDDNLSNVGNRTGSTVLNGKIKFTKKVN